MTERFEGPALAAYLRRDATREEMLELLVQRSIHNLQESDPQAFVLPRVGGPAKVALAELLYDEFGAGRPERLHSASVRRVPWRSAASTTSPARTCPSCPASPWPS